MEGRTVEVRNRIRMNNKGGGIADKKVQLKAFRFCLSWGSIWMSQCCDMNKKVHEDYMILVSFAEFQITWYGFILVFAKEYGFCFC